MKASEERAESTDFKARRQQSTEQVLDKHVYIRSMYCRSNTEVRTEGTQQHHTKIERYLLIAKSRFFQKSHKINICSQTEHFYLLGVRGFGYKMF